MNENFSLKILLEHLEKEILLPLGSLKGQADYLVTHVENPELIRYTQALSLNVDILKGYIHNMIDVSNLKYQSLKSQSEIFKLGDVFRSIKDSIEVIKEEYDREFSLELQNENLILEGDLIKLNQVLMILIHTSLRSVIKGKISLSVKNLIEGKEQALIQIKFTDHASIIPERKIHDVFKTSKEKASILGCYPLLSYLVEFMSGQVEIDSSGKNGTTLRIKLPYKVLKELETHDKQTVNEFEGVRIMLAEDSQMHTKLFEMFFRGTDIKLDIASNGQEAVDLFKQNQYDMIFMDMHMPIMDGPEAVKEIRELEKRNKSFPVAIIAASANNSPKDIQKFLNVGCDGAIAKPFHKAAIYGLVQKYAFTKTE